MPESSPTQSLFSALIAIVLFALGGAAIALYPAIMAVCIEPGWRTFWEAWALDCVVVYALLVGIVLMVVRS